MLGGIALGMSLLPEEFPLVMAVFMAMGAWRISRARVLTRRAAAIETLGATTVLCTDKTGTLTENRMTVVALHGGEGRWLDQGSAERLAGSRSRHPRSRAVRLPARTAPIRWMWPSMRWQPPRSDASAERFARLDVLPSYGLRPDLFAVANVLCSDRRTRQPRVAYAKGALEAIAELCHLPPTGSRASATQADALARDGHPRAGRRADGDSSRATSAACPNPRAT